MARNAPRNPTRSSRNPPRIPPTANPAARAAERYERFRPRRADALALEIIFMPIGGRPLARKRRTVPSVSTAGAARRRASDDVATPVPMRTMARSHRADARSPIAPQNGPAIRAPIHARLPLRLITKADVPRSLRYSCMSSTSAASAHRSNAAPLANAPTSRAEPDPRTGVSSTSPPVVAEGIRRHLQNTIRNSAQRNDRVIRKEKQREKHCNMELNHVIWNIGRCKGSHAALNSGEACWRRAQGRLCVLLPPNRDASAAPD